MLPALHSTASTYATLTRRLQGAYASGGAYRARRKVVSGARSEDAPLRSAPASCPHDVCGAHATDGSKVLPFRPR